MTRIALALALLLAASAEPLLSGRAVAATITCQGAAQCAALAAQCRAMGGRYVSNTRINGQVSGSCTT